MKSLVIYYSTHKSNTEKIAQVFAKKLKADLLNMKIDKDVSLNDYDLIGFGSGVYREAMAPQLFRLVEQSDLKGKDVFVFSTSGVGLTAYHKKLIKLLQSREANIKGSFACKGSFISTEFSENKIFELMSKLAQGHPNTKDIEKAEGFIEKVSKNKSKNKGGL